MSKPPIRYTARDYEAAKAAFQARIQSMFPNEWKDFYESSIGMAWLEMLAVCVDTLSFYLDVRANETYLGTARDRVSVINICKLVGYKLRPATAAGVVCTATIPVAQTRDVIIPAGTSVTTEGGVTFRTVEDQRILAGSKQASIEMTEGTPYTDNFVSDGSNFQKFKLAQANVVEGSIVVTVDGEEWNATDSLVYGDESSKVYTVEYDDDDYAYIQFGDNESGAVPPLNSVIQVSYRVGGGLRGNIGIGEINADVDGYLDGVVPAQYVTVHLYNEEPGSGGEERETIEHAKFWAPKWVRTNGRAVTEEDFDALATAFVDPVHGSFAFVKAKLKQEIPELNTVQLYTWARDYAGDIVAPSSGLKSALYSYFMNNGPGAVRLICTDVEVLDGEVVYVDIAALVKVFSSYAVAEVTSEVQAALDSLFSSTNIRPGEPLRLSHIYDAIQGTEGVEYTLIDNVTATHKEVEAIGFISSASAHFEVALDLPPNQPIAPHSIQITAGDLSVIDDGEGNLIGDGSGTIDYDTGEIDVTFSSSPEIGTIVQCECRYILDYQRGSDEILHVADGLTKRFKGAIEYPPIVPYHTETGQKGIAFTDGTQVVRDNGNGELIGDVDPLGVNRIDYDTGSYDFTFADPPFGGSQIRVAYRQLLRVTKEDIPIEKSLLAVKGRYTIRTS